MIDEVKATIDIKFKSWWSILKGLVFDGGPSSTRWVYLLVAATVNLCLGGMVFALCYVFMKGKAEATTLAIVAGVVTSTITALLAFATNAQNKKNQLSSQPDPPKEN